jgi:hypothetical protein
MVQPATDPELLLDVAVLNVARAKEYLARAEKELAKAQEDLTARLSSLGWKTHEYGGYRATLVKNESYKVNEMGLKRAVGARVYNKVTKSVLDKKKLEQAVTEGLIDPVIVAQNSELSESKAYIRISETTQKKS